MVAIDHMRGALGEHGSGPVVASHAVGLLLLLGGHAIGLLLLGRGVHDLVVVVDAVVVNVEDWVIMYDGWLCRMHRSGGVLMGSRLRDSRNTVGADTVVMRDWLSDDSTVGRCRVDNWLAHYGRCTVDRLSNILLSHWLRDDSSRAVSRLGYILLHHWSFHAVNNLMVDNVGRAVLRHWCHGNI